MLRREFIYAGMCTGVGELALANRGSDTVLSCQGGTGNPSPVIKSYTVEDHRERLENIGFCEFAIRTCMRRHLITDYLPAHATYNLGEYPSRTRWEPDDYDEKELRRLKDHGIQIIQVFDDWNDSLRLFGGDKYSPVNPEGFRRFVDCVHRNGMKILPYVSTGFLQRTDPDFKPEWSREGDFLVLGYWNMARCSPSSPGWRAYMMKKVLQVLDEYGADGLYNDGGYLANKHHGRGAPTTDEVSAFPEEDDYDGSFTDLLGLLYGEVKRRGGIFKLHVNGAEKPMTRGLRVYDYLWVGEGVGNLEGMRETVKNYMPYVVPCPDFSFAEYEGPHEPYLHGIPYMQFPLLQAGRPFTGERALIPGVAYNPDPNDFWMRICKEAWKHYHEHPEGPYSYGAWDAIPGRADIRPAHLHWVKQYLCMVEEGTCAYLEVGDSDLFLNPLPEGTVASVFANRDIYLVLANYSGSVVNVATRDNYFSLSSPDAPSENLWKMEGRTLKILRLAKD
jgi:hypothetical protein